MDYLSRVEILEALRQVALELDFDEARHELIIAGGAALVVLYEARMSTKDVDAVKSNQQIQQAAQGIAEKLDLPRDWLNDGAKGYLHGLERGEIVLEMPSLVVWALAPTQLLAMKLSAWRDDLDIEDARLLLSKLQGSMDQVWRQIESFLISGRELKARYAFEDLWEAIHGVSPTD